MSNFRVVDENEEPSWTTMSPLAAAKRAGRRVVAALPVGRGLSVDLWERRHRGIVVLLWLHVPGLFLVSMFTHHTFLHSLADPGPIVVCAAIAGHARLPRNVRAGVATLGLILCSALLVHLSGGNIEMHFHFFVMVGVITLYQDWVPFTLAIGFVVIHHGVIGVLMPEAVYNHAGAQRNPWLWAGVHGLFVLGASTAHVLAWRLNEDQALRDPLTRLPNRALFADRLRTTLLRHARYGTEAVVLFIDLDGFKVVNDTLGHHAGDRLLVEFGRRIRGVLRQVDTAARLGGDEFAVLLDDCSGADGMVVAERILRELRTPMHQEGRDFLIGASIGLVAVDRETSADDVLRNADLAMYMAKASGRNRIEVFQDAMFDRAVADADLETDLRRAVEAGAIDVYYQPSVELETGAIVGMEALARWNDPERGSVPPGVFIPIAESTGLIIELGRLVLRTACADGAFWRAEHPELTVAVNVSVRQIASETFVDDVAEVLRATGLDPHALVLEITESVLVHDVEVTAAQLGRLKELGVRLAIDDFGTGYSSLSYLRHFPIDIVKIDRSFIEQLPGEGTALTRSIVRLGESLHLDVIAEGVEDDGQRDELTRLGCRHGQGFLFAQATPAAQINTLLSQSAAQEHWWGDGSVPAQRSANRDVHANDRS